MSEQELKHLGQKVAAKVASDVMLSEEPGIADNEYGLAHDNDDYNRRFERSDDMLQRRMVGESSDAMHMEEDVEDAEAADLVAEKDYFNKG